MPSNAHYTQTGTGGEFRDPVSVDAWDAWFRWRDHAGLHDPDIDATWRRVAGALARAESDGAPYWACEFEDVLRNWQALPDARVLAGAGTGTIAWPGGDLAAVVNIAAFVRDPFTPHARLDRAALEHAAGVCVRMLDNAILLAGEAKGASRLQIGPIGVADALLMLGLPYDSDAGRAHAHQTANSLAMGCIHESLRLALERGSRVRTIGKLPQTLSRLKSPALAAEVAHHGMRHGQLTAVTRQRRLAMLANNVADALDPLRPEAQQHHVDSTGGPRVFRSHGSTLELLARRTGTVGMRNSMPEVPVATTTAGQLAMRAAVQPWIDVRIDYPIAALPPA